MLINNVKYQNIFKYWLLVTFSLLVLMVLVGGLTRLTDSGLSITQWELFSGILPPLTNNAWQRYFALYKTIPQFTQLNFDMSLSQFKVIFFWEYIHRLLGRLIGIFYLLPLVYFSLNRILKKKYIARFFFIFVLILFQGVIGWYMVESGLTNKVTVSHYRLASHLSIAFVIISLVYWNFLNILNFTNYFFLSAKKFNIWFYVLLALVFIQIIFGAFVSGLDAGKIYQTWPLMNLNYIPDDIQSSKDLLNFSNHSSVQFIHRNLAYFIIIYSLLLSFKIYNQDKKIFKYYKTVLLFILLQILIGIITLISGLNFILASLHQITSLLLVLTILRLIFRTNHELT